MNREQIIQMARYAGSSFAPEVGSWLFTNAELERFAYAIRAATKDEDAKICEALGDETDNPIDGVFVNHPPYHCARAIRASK